MLVVRATCDGPLVDAITRLSGVRGAACANESFLTGQYTVMATMPDGSSNALTQAPIQPGVLKLFGLKPVAGPLCRRARQSPDRGSAQGGRAARS